MNNLLIEKILKSVREHKPIFVEMQRGDLLFTSKGIPYYINEVEEGLYELSCDTFLLQFGKMPNFEWEDEETFVMKDDEFCLKFHFGP